MMIALLALVMGGCDGGGGWKLDETGATSGPPDGPIVVDSADSADTDTDTEVFETEETEPPPFDCSMVPPGPAGWQQQNGPVATEDLSFDSDGFLIGSDMNHIWRSLPDGTAEIWVPNFPTRAGMRMLPDGALAVADNNAGSLVRVDPDGTRTTMVTDLRYPNGLEIGPGGIVYLTEHDAKKIHRIDPYTGEDTVISSGEVSNPNGITFNLDYTALYLGGFSGEAKLYKLPVDEDGFPNGPIEVFAEGVGTGWLDGMGVDVCGNVYVADYGRSKILRYTPDGEFMDDVVDMSGSWNYLPNMAWGEPAGGWDPTRLYVPEGWMGARIYVVELGVPGKPPPQ